MTAVVSFRVFEVRLVPDEGAPPPGRLFEHPDVAKRHLEELHACRDATQRAIDLIRALPDGSPEREAARLDYADHAVRLAALCGCQLCWDCASVYSWEIVPRDVLGSMP